MLKPEQKNFKVSIYRFEGRTFLCPDSELNPGQLVIAFQPLKRHDPLNKYCFVVAEGQTHSVSRRQLALVRQLELTYTRQPFSTFNQEMVEQIKVMDAYLKQYTDPSNSQLRTMQRPLQK